MKLSRILIATLATATAPLAAQFPPGLPPVEPDPPGAPLPAPAPIPLPGPPQAASAMEAVSTFRAITGITRLNQVVELRGARGAPTPAIWTIVVHDPASPTRLSEFSIRGPRVDDPKPSKDFYPARAPEGYFDFAKVTVDSRAAFRAADREAGIARIGFDFIDYRLRCREFSDDPIWDLTLRTSDGIALGTISISNKTGRVLRAVWMRPGPRGALSIAEDSAEPGARPLSTQVPITPRSPSPAPAPAEVRPSPPAGEPQPTDPVPAPAAPGADVPRPPLGPDEPR
jgi:hypothetical protein